MPEVGQSLSHYRIVEKLGQGGMGEVYRADDMNLSRQVAIKVLPDELVHDAERLARFQREAQVLASISHPNITTLYGLEESNGKRFIVMELVEGQTLARRLQKGPLPVEQALDVCRQLAEGLEAAHEKGVIHRDLKPGNVMLTAEDKVKIFDFGLAKEIAAESHLIDATRSPTITEAMTQAGVILGTAAYMSPEQAKGKPVDRRADIWAFGCIAFECLTGRQAFHGDTVTETLSLILQGEPDWKLLPIDTPPTVRTMIRRCLEKNRHDRLRDVGDLGIELREAIVRVPDNSNTTPRSRRTSRWPWILGVNAAMLLAASLVLWMLASDWFGPEVRSYAIHFVISPGMDNELDFSTFASPFDISPDGRNIVYSLLHRGSSQLFLRPVNQFDGKAIPGTEGASAPFFAPDGQSIGFFAAGKIKRISIDGGPSQEVCEAAGNTMGATWAEDDQIIFAPDISGLLSVPAGGGAPKQLTTPDVGKGEIGHLWPHALPGGKGVLFSVLTEEARHLAVLSMQRGRWETLIKAGGEARYLVTGHLLYQDSASLLVAPFDLAQLKLTGRPIPVLQGLRTGQMGGEDRGFFAVSAMDTLAYVPGIYLTGLSRLLWVDRSGHSTPLPLEPAGYNYPRISPDGTRLAVGVDRAQIWICDVDSGRKMRLTQGGISYVPVWTPDGRRIAFGTYRAGNVNIFWKKADSNDVPEALLVNRDERKFPASWHPDGRTLIFNTLNARTGGDISSLPIGGKPQSLHRSLYQEGLARLSPDGRWLAYISNESGRIEVYVQSFPEGARIVPISTEGGDEPVWSHSGRELFFRNGNKMMAVDIVTRPEFRAGKPRFLFEGPYNRRTVQFLLGAYYDISLDDQRFLMSKPVEQNAVAAQINVVVNWFEELKRLVPTGNK